MKSVLSALLVASFLAAPMSILWGVDTSSVTVKAFVSIIPQAYFVERVGGRYVDVEVLVGPGQSPATFEPTSRQMSRLSGSAVYFRIGVPFEKVFIPKITDAFKGLHIVDTSAGVKLRYFSLTGGPQVPDPHIWLDPKRVKIIAGTICSELSRIDPLHSKEFEQNLNSFEHDLEILDQNIAGILKPFMGGKIFVFHPAFGYFAQSYGLEQVAVEVEGKEPSARQLSSLINKAKAEQVSIIFVQPQFSRKNAETIAQAIGGAVVPINPLPEDYLRELENMADEIRNALSRRQALRN
ncbi:MAG: zinc ABC transporter substrate-binding protein [Deltaproteobacteria bacterium]|nr:zinc ABC transporter substrate-binding protein [Deltaproteobacteria bacterium]